MKTKMLLIGMLSVLALAACQNDEVKNVGEPKQVEKENAKKEKSAIEENEKENITVEKEEEKIEEKAKEDHSDHQHNNSADEVNGLKAEDVIVTYFNAISLADVDTLNKVYPNAVEENSRISQLFNKSEIKTDIIGMKKISLSSDKAQYEVDVKIYTKEKDDNFTDNVSKYKMNIDLTKGVLESTAITSTNYLE